MASSIRVVGIKELKARLSEYLREVRAGETFLVTDRDRVVAELRPPRLHSVEPADPVAAGIDALVESGDITPPRLPRQNWTWPADAGLRPGTADVLLRDLRADREYGNE